MRRIGLLVIGAVAAANGCSSGEAADAVPATGVTRAELEAFSALENDTRTHWKWLQHDDLQTPLHLSTGRVGAPILERGDDIVLRTIDVLLAHRALFDMRDPAAELVVTRHEHDYWGMQHVRFQQVSRGVPVVGAEVTVHYDHEGHLTSIDANYIHGLDDVDVNPSVVAPPGARLVIYEKRLAYEYRPDALWIVTIDAHTGEELHRLTNLQTIAASGVGVLGDTKKFEVSNGDGGFVMTDASSGISLETYSAGQAELSPGALVTSNSATSWDAAAVDAHFNAGVVARYYKSVHGRNAIDGVGGALQSTVHYGAGYENAAWNETGMIYGDGGKLYKPLSVAIDIVGHEFTHGVTEKTSHLTYEGQPGALNEAVSDIFGAFIEHSIAPDARKNWTIGELVTLAGGPLRDMMQPHDVATQPQPAHMKEYLQTQQDSGGVHINSGIMNNAAWLMTVGGTNPYSGIQVKYGIGWEKSEKLWYQAATNYFQASTGFVQAAAGLQQAGKDVQLTANELAIVDCAFKATGVTPGDCETLSPTDFSEQQAKADADDDDDSAAKKKPSSKKKKTITTEEPGCTAASSDPGSLIPIFAALAAIRMTRRRRGNFSA